MKRGDKVTSVKAIRDYFGDSRTVDVVELKNLPKEDRDELANLIAEEIGVEIVAAAGAAK